MVQILDLMPALRGHLPSASPPQVPIKDFGRDYIRTAVVLVQTPDRSSVCPEQGQSALTQGRQPWGKGSFSWSRPGGRQIEWIGRIHTKLFSNPEDTFTPTGVTL